MAASCNSFTDLPSEIRNQIYDEYLANVEDTAVAVCSGKILPPTLAHTSTQIRKMFMSI